MFIDKESLKIVITSISTHMNEMRCESTCRTTRVEQQLHGGPIRCVCNKIACTHQLCSELHIWSGFLFFDLTSSCQQRFSNKSKFLCVKRWLQQQMSRLSDIVRATPDQKLSRVHLSRSTAKQECSLRPYHWNGAAFIVCCLFEANEMQWWLDKSDQLPACRTATLKRIQADRMCWPGSRIA